MTEKRFEMVIVDVQGNFYYLDRVTDEKISSTLALEGKLNELANENEQLKSDVQMCREKALYWRNKAKDIFGDMKTNIELKQENEQLKQSLKNKMDSDNYWEQKATEKIKELEEENEQLKKELNTFKQVVFQDTTNNGTIVLYAKEYGDVE